MKYSLGHDLRPPRSPRSVHDKGGGRRVHKCSEGRKDVIPETRFQEYSLSQGHVSNYDRWGVRSKGEQGPCTVLSGKDRGT